MPYHHVSVRIDLTVFILKEKRTREINTGCSKYSFKIADRTGEVTSKHFFEMVDKTDLVYTLIFTEYESAASIQAGLRVALGFTDR